MADRKLSELTELAATPADGDEVYIRDVSEATADESKRITVANLVAAAAPAAIKVKLETRDMTAVAGDVSYTGYGFLPTGLIIIACRVDTAFSIGSAVPALAEHGMALMASTAPDTKGTFIVYLEPIIGNRQEAVLKTFDADGFTLTWAKTGVPDGTGKLHVFAFK